MEKFVFCAEKIANSLIQRSLIGALFNLNGELNWQLASLKFQLILGTLAEIKDDLLDSWIFKGRV